MSRGPGDVMRKVLRCVMAAQADHRGCLTYRELARLVYGIEGGSPTKAQMSAVARATRRLEQDFMVEIYALAEDRRVKVVGLSPWVVFGSIIPPGAMSYRSSSWYSMLKVRVAAMRGLVDAGAITISMGEETFTPRERALIVDADRRDVV